MLFAILHILLFFVDRGWADGGFVLAERSLQRLKHVTSQGGTLKEMFISVFDVNCDWTMVVVRGGVAIIKRGDGLECGIAPLFYLTSSAL